MDRYSARMNLRGTTQRERAKTRLINNLNNKLPGSLSYKPILLNGEPTQLIINTGTQPYYKEFESMPGQNINIGDYVEWANSHWIVTTCDSDDEIYRDGKLEQCNYLLKWQNDEGRIISRWAVVQSASKYNDGTDGNNIITVGSDQLSVVIPLDKEALKLKKSMGVKFFIDNNKEDPTAYELTGTGNVPDTYGGHGVTAWIVKECQYTASELDLKYGVCEYRPPKKRIRGEEVDDLKCHIIGKDIMTNRYKREYRAVFMDKNKNVVDNVNFRWVVTSDFKIDQVVNGNEIELYTEDPSKIGESFLLSVVHKGTTMASMRILITEGF